MGKSQSSLANPHNQQQQESGPPHAHPPNQTQIHVSTVSPSEGASFLPTLQGPSLGSWIVLNCFADIILPALDKLKSTFEKAELESLQICAEVPLNKASFVSLIAPPSENADVDDWGRLAEYLFRLAVVTTILLSNFRMAYNFKIEPWL
jgi:hypothetical protein